MIVTITLNPAIDRLLLVDGTLTKRKTNRIKAVSFDCGGKGIHVSHVLSRFGVPNLALGITGSRNLEQLQAILKQKGIKHDFIVENGVSTRECIVITDSETSGSTMITEQGFEISELSHQALMNKVKERVAIADIVVIAGSPPPSYPAAYLQELLEVVTRSGCFVACDLSGPALQLAVKLGVDFIKPNEHELLELVGHEVTDPVAVLRALADQVGCIVASMGKLGCYCLHEGDIYQVTPPDVVEKNDTGAGDVFVGSFIACLAQGKSIEEILTMASASAASKVMQADSSSFDLTEAKRLRRQVVVRKL